MVIKCECCDKKFDHEPIYVQGEDETFIVCSTDCEKLMTTHDPHCTCNTCIMEFRERQEQAILEEIQPDFIVK